MQQTVRTFKDLREGLFPKLLGKIIFGILRGVVDGNLEITLCDFKMREAGIILPNTPKDMGRIL